MNSFLITLPNYDDATGYLFEYSKEIIRFAVSKGKKALQLSKPRLTRRNVESAISKQDVNLILFNGHGDTDTIYGDKINGKEEPLIRAGINHKILGKKLVYARACNAASELGAAIAECRGCFIGYKMPFSFWTDERHSSTPLKDNIAGLFLLPSNALAMALIKGQTAREAYDKFIALSQGNMLKLLKTKDEPGALASAMVLWNNIQGQTICGDESMRWA